MKTIDVAVGVVEGKVIAKWHDPITQIEFDAANAYSVGEALARAAHEVAHGSPVQSDESYIAAQIRNRVTDTLRMRMIQRVVLVMGSLERKHRTPGQIATAVVEAMLREVT